MDIRQLETAAARSVCDCGNEMKNQFGPCAQCERSTAAIYHPNGKRRVFNHELKSGPDWPIEHRNFMKRDFI